MPNKDCYKVKAGNKSVWCPCKDCKVIEEAVESYAKNYEGILSPESIEKSKGFWRGELTRIGELKKQEGYKEVLLEIMDEYRTYGLEPYMWPASGEVKIAMADFDGTNAKRYIQIWNAALSTLKDKLNSKLK